MPAWSAGAARTTPALSTNTAEIPAAAEIAHDLRHPVEIDAGNDDRILLTIDRRYRIGRHHDRPVAGFGEQEIAENEAAGFARLLEIFPVAEIKAYQVVQARALNQPVLADDHDAADPGQINRQAGAQYLAAARDASRGADIGRRFQHRLDRGDDFALGIGAVLREICKFLGGQRD